jgi:hypothetical protein
MAPPRRLRRIVRRRAHGLHPAVWLLLTAMLTTVLLLIPAEARAHSPLTAGGNESLGTAMVISDPTKSWVVYADLHASVEAQYYRLHAAAGDRITLTLFTSPAGAEDGFIPSLVVMGPGIVDSGAAPAFVERPTGSGIRTVTGHEPADVAYEPFSPSAMREVASHTLTAPEDGVYHVAVHGNARGGRYGLAIGSRESFTPVEWATIPLSIAVTYAWEGQPLWLVYLPAALVVALGLALLPRWSDRRGRLGLPGWIAALAGLLFLASAVTMVVQMIIALVMAGPEGAVVVTLFLAALPAIVGVVTLHLALQGSGTWTTSTRVLLAVLGGAALLVWAGWLLGPALAVLAALLPTRCRGAVGGGAAPGDATTAG